MSDLIRDAIDRVYASASTPEPMTLEEKLRVIRETAGAWKDRDETGEEYVERLRSGRLGRLHGWRD